MKFSRFADGRTGLVLQAGGLKVLDVRASILQLRLRSPAAAKQIESVLPSTGPEPWGEMIERWDSVRSGFEKLVELAESGDVAEDVLHAFETTPLAAPLASPVNHIFSMSSNTVVHIQRAFKVMFGADLSADDVLKAKLVEGLPPGGFTIWPDSVVGPNAVITPPRGTKLLDYEAECAVYVRQGGRNLDEVALWGYAAWNDLGIRDLNLNVRKDSRFGPFSLNLVKNFDSGNACGPWVVVDEDFDLGRLQCRLTVNGEERQNWNLADMIYSFNEMLSYISTYATLRPGDILTSGTGAGTAIEKGVDGSDWLKAGDEVAITLDGAGTLRNFVGSW